VPRLPILALDATPNLHLYAVTLVAHNTVAPLPPPGAFNWHYLQCVIEVFGTQSTRISLISNILFILSKQLLIFRTTSMMTMMKTTHRTLLIASTNIWLSKEGDRWPLKVTKRWYNGLLGSHLAVDSEVSFSSFAYPKFLLCCIMSLGSSGDGLSRSDITRTRGLDYNNKVINH